MKEIEHLFFQQSLFTPTWLFFFRSFKKKKHLSISSLFSQSPDLTSFKEPVFFSFSLLRFHPNIALGL